MQATEIEGVFKRNGRLYTINLCKGMRVYGESLKTVDGVEYRSWNPYRSKLAAAILKGIKIDTLNKNSKVLYLGAATGTTVSHLSDIVSEIYAVEYSAFAMKKLLELAKKRSNIIPILADANHPHRYLSIVPKVDFLYQDISQRNQVDIFIENVDMYLKSDGRGLLMVKTRSIDVALPPEKIVVEIEEEIRKHGFNVLQKKYLKPYEKDHAALLVEGNGNI
ncbi:MAG: fibrillarin-like rRNA/tRNA 2'-O-methyltransferase [Thermoplasmata archaeon]|nr:MAG: fibrillarin-like rRNA/tRNA 2'-O-methyltransferase [Thermoplasmata archaeon]